jgi:predicted alpha/beta hydrolase family esterase
MKNAIILHGTQGAPDNNWFMWLKGELEQGGLTVWLPQLPRPEQPSLKLSAEYVRANCPFAIDEQTLLVGHSSGAILALILAQQNAMPVGGVVAISVFHDNSLGWDANNKLFDVPFEWDKIRANARQLLFVHSDNDPYVPLDQAEFVSRNCGAQTVVMPGQGHFNLEQGPQYSAFPKLIELMQQRGLLV